MCNNVTKCTVSNVNICVISNVSSCTAGKVSNCIVSCKRLDMEINDTHSPYCSYFVFLFYAEINRLKIPKKHKYL